jgi:hypothetical protein
MPDPASVAALGNTAADSITAAPATQPKSMLAQWWEKIKSVFSKLQKSSN